MNIFVQGFFVAMFHFFREEWLCYVVNLSLTLKETAKLFSKWLYDFILTPEMCVPIILHLYLHWLSLVLLILAILVVV